MIVLIAKINRSRIAYLVINVKRNLMFIFGTYVRFSSCYKRLPCAIKNILATEKNTTMRPNYFVAVQVKNEQIHSSVKLVQDHLLLQNEQLLKSLISRSSLHLTLMVLHIKDADDYSRAMEALSTVCQEYNSIIGKDLVKLEFSGLGHFKNRVLYVKLKKNKSYQLLCDLAKNVHIHLEKVGIVSTDKRSEFTPHLTIAKLDMKKKSSKKLRNINSLWYKDFTDFDFGCDTVKSIQLLKMQGPKTDLGYYTGEELFFDSNNAKIVLEKLGASMAIADKKEEIRSKISEITKKMNK